MESSFEPWQLGGTLAPDAAAISTEHHCRCQGQPLVPGSDSQRQAEGAWLPRDGWVVSSHFYFHYQRESNGTVRQGLQHTHPCPTHTHTHTHTHTLLSSLPRKDKVFSFLSTVSISPLILTSPRHLFSIPTKGIQISPDPTEEIHTMKLQVSTLNSGSPTSNGLSPAQKSDCISLINSLFRTTEWLFQTSIPLRSLKVVRIHCPTGWNEKSILLSQRLGASDPTNPNS